MLLTPLADRVLILPDTQPTQTASGLHLAEHYKPEQTGTVVAVGTARHPRKEEAFAMADAIESVNHDDGVIWAMGTTLRDQVLEAATLLRELTGREPEVKVGDYVVFSWTVGQEVFINDGEARYLLMKESDILAVIEGVTA